MDMVQTFVHILLFGLFIWAIVVVVRKGREHEQIWLKNKLMFQISIVLFILVMILNVPFPHEAPYGESLLTILNIPIRFAEGFHTVGIIILCLFLLGSILLFHSLKKYQLRSVLLAILTVSLLPAFIVYLFQNTLATGIYAIAYSNEAVDCEFKMVDSETLHGECRLDFENYSNSVVDFQFEFYEEKTFPDDLPMLSLMNEQGSYEVTIEPGERVIVFIEADIDVSEMEQHIEGGNATGFNIIIKADGNIRKL